MYLLVEVFEYANKFSQECINVGFSNNGEDSIPKSYIDHVNVRSL